jgi:parvulin-like peptidyl-prolyl isomerase
MAKNPKKPILTKKHLARQEREQIQRRYILLASGLVLLAVIALIVYGILEQTVLFARQPVAIVNGEKITTKLFQDQTRYSRYTLIASAGQTMQFAQLFGGDPSTTASFVNQLQQIQVQLDPETVGQKTLDQLIDDVLIREEAKKRGIVVTKDEVEKAFQEAFGYYAEGTPTPTPTLEVQPTSTLSPLQETLTAPTPTSEATGTPQVTATPETTQAVATATPEPTATPETTATPSATGEITPTATATTIPTPTPYTFQAYQEQYKKSIQNFEKDYGISEADLRYVVETQLYRKKVRDAIVGDLSHVQEEVWARHILVPDQATAQIVIDQLNAGESWYKLAATMSTDTSNKDKGGDLGWFWRGRMVPEFDDVAFKLKVGEISEPVKTQFGYHIIQVLGHEDRQLTGQEYQAFQDQKFQEWLTSQRDAAKIDTRDYWRERVPAEPTLPAEVVNFIQQNSAPQQPTPPIIPPVTEPPPLPTQQQ